MAKFEAGNIVKYKLTGEKFTVLGMNGYSPSDNNVIRVRNSVLEIKNLEEPELELVRK